MTKRRKSVKKLAGEAGKRWEIKVLLRFLDLVGWAAGWGFGSDFLTQRRKDAEAQRGRKMANGLIEKRSPLKNVINVILQGVLGQKCERFLTFIGFCSLSNGVSGCWLYDVGYPGFPGLQWVTTGICGMGCGICGVETGSDVKREEREEREGERDAKVQEVRVPLGGTSNCLLCRVYTVVLSFTFLRGS